MISIIGEKLLPGLLGEIIGIGTGAAVGASIVSGGRGYTPSTDGATSRDGLRQRRFPGQ